MNGFAKSAILLFAAMRCGDIVNLAAGMWFVPRYVAPEEIGAVLPATSFATFLALPVFAFAMTMMKETAVLSAAGEHGKVKSLLRGMFIATAAALAIAIILSLAVAPRFLKAIGVRDCSAGMVAVAAAFIGCAAPVYTDALQAMKRFRSLAAVETASAVVRFLVLLIAMPFRALAGFFAGQAAQGFFRMAGSAALLERELAAPAEPYWGRATFRRVAAAFFCVLLYQAFPMFASLVQDTALRTALPAADSAGYYMATRISGLLNYFTYPLLVVMFPYTAAAAGNNASTRPFVLKCSAATLAAAAILAGVSAAFGGEILSLMPHGVDYIAYAGYIPVLVLGAALTACQVFYTNAEVSAGRFAFLRWLIPLNIAYPAVLWAMSAFCRPDLAAIVAISSTAALAHFVFAVRDCRLRR